MHLAVKRDILDDLAPVGLESGAKVVDIDSAESGHQPVGAARGNAAKDKVVAALGTPAADNVVAFFELGEEVGDLVGRVLEISVHGENTVALSVIKTSGKSRGLAEVAAKLDDENTRIYGCNLFKQTVGAVAGAVVNEDQFEGLSYVLHDGLEAVVQSGDVLFFVVEWNDDGVFRHLTMILLASRR